MHQSWAAADGERPRNHLLDRQDGGVPVVAPLQRDLPEVLALHGRVHASARRRDGRVHMSLRGPRPFCRTKEMTHPPSNNALLHHPHDLCGPGRRTWPFCRTSCPLIRIET